MTNLLAASRGLAAHDFAVMAAVSVIAAALALGCSSGGAAEDAVALRAHVDAIDIEIPANTRKESVEKLRSLTLRTKEARAIRDTCVEGHDALVSAELDSAEARRTLAAKGDEELSQKEHETLSSLLSRSDASIEKARGLLDRCRDGVSKFVVEHPSRRANP